MIELFDAGRLLPRRDTTAWVALALLLMGGAAVGGRTWHLQQGLQQAEREHQTTTAAMRALQAAKQAQPTLSTSLLTDLERETERVEAEVLAARGGEASEGLKPSQWMERLENLAQSDIGLVRVAIDRAGTASVEGQALTAQAVSRYVESWERQDAHGLGRARTVELKRDTQKDTAKDRSGSGLINFQLRATAQQRP